jgi:hypothetical protein
MLESPRPFLPGHVDAWLAMLVLAYVIGVLPAFFAGIAVALLEKPCFGVFLVSIDRRAGPNHHLRANSMAKAAERGQ